VMIPNKEDKEEKGERRESLIIKEGIKRSA
jgi:hypothetical protein